MQDKNKPLTFYFLTDIGVVESLNEEHKDLNVNRQKIISCKKGKFVFIQSRRAK